MKVLMPLDGSARSGGILAWAPVFLQRAEARIHLLHVSPADESTDATHSVGDRQVPCGDYVQEIARQALPGIGRIETFTERGDPTLDIIRHSKKHGIDLLAMCTKSRQGLSRVLMGSVTTGVMDVLDGPFLLAGPVVKFGGPAPAIRRILAPVDASEMPRRMVGHIADWARAWGAEVTIFYVAGEGPRDVQGRLDAWAETLKRDGVKCSVFMSQGDPATEIVNQVFQPGYDLIAMTTHRRSLVTRLLLGSVAEAVVRTSPCPVLLWRPD